MKHFLLFIFAVISTANLSAQVLADTSFEASGAANTPWASTSTTFGTSFCDDGCGDCGGPCSPNTGTWYVWFGGTTGAEIGTAVQTYTASATGTGTLTYYWKVPMRGSVMEGADSLYVSMDGVRKSSVAAYDSIGTYQLVTLNVGQITAGPHTLNFTFQKGASTAVTNVLLDDVQLRISGSLGVEEIDFMDGVQISSNVDSKKIVVKYNLNGSQNLHLAATDMTGKTIYSNQFDHQQTDMKTIETNGWVPGLYNVTLSSDKGLTKTTKVIVY